MEGHDHIPEPAPGSSLSMIAVMAAVLPILYVLSIGPAAVLVGRFPALETPATIFYFPLIWVIDGTPLGAPIIRYIELWM